MSKVFNVLFFKLIFLLVKLLFYLEMLICAFNTYVKETKVEILSKKLCQFSFLEIEN